MVIKVIRLRVRVGHLPRYLDLQRRWNEVMAQQPGFMWAHVGLDAADEQTVLIVVGFRTQDALDRFMAGPHDEVMRETEIDDCYDEIAVTISRVVQPEPSGVPITVDEPRASVAQSLIALGQSFRVTAVLRHAVEAGLFDAIARNGGNLGAVGDALGADEEYVHRVLAVLASCNLVEWGADGVRLSELAEVYLRWDSDHNICDLILHDASPRLFDRWGAPDERMRSRHAKPSDVVFADAMTAIARSGQADAFEAGVRRAGVLAVGDRVLDVGGGLGDYARRLAAIEPSIRATVLDLPHVIDLAVARGLADGTIDFVAGDYRAGLPEGPFDVLLLSNILRGETPPAADELLARVHHALRPGGRVAVQDLLTVDEFGSAPPAAALFGLHLPDACNPSLVDAVGLLRDHGFTDVETTMLDVYVASNVLIVGHR